MSLLWLLVTDLVWLLCCFMGLGVGYFVSLVMFAMFYLVGWLDVVAEFALDCWFECLSG